MIENVETRHELEANPKELRILSGDAPLPGVSAVVVLSETGSSPRIETEEVVPVAPASALLSRMAEASQTDVERFPASRNVRLNHAIALINAQRLGEASELLRQLQSDFPRDVRVRIVRARLLAVRGQFQEARAEADRALELDPKNLDALKAQAETALQARDFSSARRLWTTIAKLETESAVGPFQAGIAALGEGHAIDEGIRLFREAARRRPKWASAQQGLGVAYQLAGNSTKARKHFEIALALTPDLTFATLGLARALESAGDAPGSTALLSKAVKANPGSVDLREHLAWRYMEDERSSEARAELIAALRTMRQLPAPPAFEFARVANNAGVHLTQVKNWVEAEEAFRGAANVQAPTALRARNNLGLLLLRRNRTVEAREVLADLIDSDIGDEATYMITSEAWFKDRSITNARDVLELARERSLASTPTYATLGFLLSDWTGETSKAVEVLREGHAKFPTEALVANNLAYALLMMGNIGEAKSVLASISERNDLPLRLQAIIQATSGLLALKEGDIASGRRGYQEAAETAAASQDSALLRAVRQKGHLEVARALRYLDPASAEAEAELGLRIPGRPNYHSDLEALRNELQASDAQTSSLQIR
jgi:tetratricopeptide (TPR) repeat protein